VRGRTWPNPPDGLGDWGPCSCRRRFLGALYVLTVGALGPVALTHVRWPVVFVLDHVTLDSAFFLSRIGIVVVFSWTLGVMLGLIVHLRLVWTLVPVRPGTRLGGSGILLAGWALVALRLFPSPLASTRVLLRWLDPGAVWYLLVEMIIVGGMGSSPGAAHATPHNPAFRPATGRVTAPSGEISSRYGPCRRKRVTGHARRF